MLGTMLDVQHKIYHFNSPNNPITLVLSSFYTPGGKKFTELVTSTRIQQYYKVDTDLISCTSESKAKRKSKDPKVIQ